MRASLLIVALLAAGCPGDDEPVCGPPEDAGVAAIVLVPEGAAETFTFGDFQATHARDCGLESTTISGPQVAPAPAGPTGLTICVARGDLIGAASIDVSDAAVVPQLEATAQSDTCTWVRSFASPPTGTVSFAGYCDGEGDDFNLTFDVTIPVTATCDGGPATSTTVDVSGTVRVDFPAL